MSGPTNPTQSGSGFLSFNSLPPRLWITAEPDTEEGFDQTVMQHWRQEGYDVTYLPLGTDNKAYIARLKTLADDLELGETFALVAYGDAATVCLHAILKPIRHLGALVCYYPTSLPAAAAKYPTQLRLTVHLTASQGFTPKFEKVFTYTGVEPGFAEHDCDEFSSVEAGLAWSRTLAAVRRGFKKDEGEKVEEVWEQQQALRHVLKDAAAAAGQMATDAETTYVPALTGATGQRNLYRFYRDFFIGQQPSGFRIRLLSRTVGVDRVVDEMIVSFKHDKEVSWMLPNTPATGKHVEIPMVSIVAVRGDRLAHEHVYWDQASVLVQIGLLDPSVLPGYMRKQGMQQLPITGVSQAVKLRNPGAVELNELLPKWKQVDGQSRTLSVRGSRPAQQRQRAGSGSEPSTPQPKTNVRGGRPPKRQANGKPNGQTPNGQTPNVQTPNGRGRAPVSP